MSHTTWKTIRTSLLRSTFGLKPQITSAALSHQIRKAGEHEKDNDLPLANLTGRAGLHPLTDVSLI